MSLLDALSPKQREAFSRRAEEALRRGVRELEARLARPGDGDRFARMAERGSLAVARARLRWFREVRATIQGGS